MGAKVHVLHCGYIKIAKHLSVSGGRFTTDIVKAATVPDRGRIILPVSTYLIEHNTGIYLVATVLSREIRTDGASNRKAGARVLPQDMDEM